MRRSALILLIVAASAGPGPGPGKKPEPPPPLPPLNARVADFARASLGKPVGDGVCITLAVEALRAAGARPAPFNIPSGDYVWGQPVEDIKDTLPGDLLQFRDAVFRGKRSLGRTRYETWHYEYPHHTAIVAKVEQAGKLVTILHQNVALDGRPEAEKGNVKEGILRMDSLQKGGWVRAYRPVPADPPRRPFAEDQAG